MKTFQFPCVVLIDSREKTPYTFQNLKADSVDGCHIREQPLAVATKIVSLKSGDYTLDGSEDKLCIERKSLSDIFNTVSQHRARFERLLERMSHMEFAAIVIEASYADMLQNPPAHSDLLPKSLVRSLLSWMQRYRVHVIPVADRRMGEIFTFRMLQRFYLSVTPTTRKARSCPKQKRIGPNLPRIYF